MANATHHSIRESLLGRIQSGEWELGALIPAEMILAEEYGCARTTVNRALQALADEGLVIRKRKGGTRVCNMPVRYAKFEIPLLREQVEVTGRLYSHQLLGLEMKIPPRDICARLKLSDTKKALYLETVHKADESPFAFETRWINTKAVPSVFEAPLERISANEWLVKTVPFSSGDVMFGAVSASQSIADAMDVKIGAALFTIDRTTWFGDKFITTMSLYYKQGFQLSTRL